METPICQTNKENYNPAPKPTKPNKFSSWVETKALFLSSQTSCDLLNYETQSQNNQTPSLSVIEHQPNVLSPLPSLELKTCPIDFDLLDMGFIEQTPNTTTKSNDHNIKTNENFQSKSGSWIDFSDFKPQVQEKKLIIITENGLESSFFVHSTISRPNLVALLTDIGVNLERGFYLIDNEGKVYFLDDIPHLNPNNVYYVKSSADDLNIMANFEEKNEKSKLEMDSFCHVEFLSALKILQEGATLLKATKSGHAKFKFFQLNKTNSSLFWYSCNKLNTQTQIPLHKIQEVKIGQKTKGFEKLGMTNLLSISFSLKYFDESNDENFLDIICKNRYEFDLVLTAIKGLVSSVKGEKICKHMLLSHCKRFILMIQEKHPFDCKSLWDLQETDSLKIENILLKPISEEKELFSLLASIEKRFQQLLENKKILIGKVMNEKGDVTQDEENLKIFFPFFCKRYITLQKELCEFCNIDLPNLKMFLDFIPLNSIDITKDLLENVLFKQRPEEKKNMDLVLKYFNILHVEIWKLGLDLDNIKDFTERINDRILNKNKIEKIAGKVEEKIKSKLLY